MKRRQLVLMLAVALFSHDYVIGVAHCTTKTDPIDLRDGEPIAVRHDYVLGLKEGGRALALVNARTLEPVKQCQISTKDPIDEIRANSAQDAVIVSATEFIPVSALETCTHALIPQRIPKKVGFLADINLNKGIYLALEAVSVSPVTYVATVAKIGKTKLLSSLPGANIPSYTLKQLKNTAFTYSPERPPRISTDGRYVSPSGAIDCRRSAYPGVWDIQENKKVVLEDGTENATEICKALFNDSDAQ